MYYSVTKGWGIAMSQVTCLHYCDSLIVTIMKREKKEERKEGRKKEGRKLFMSAPSRKNAFC